MVSVGRAVPKKGFDDLLRALAALPPDLGWRFSHIGGGPLLPDLKNQVQAASLAERIDFLGAKAQPDVVELLREADLFVLCAKEAPSGDRDGLPNVLLEAASQGLTIVASDFAGIPEFIRDGVDGRLVPPGDVEALASAIEALARDPTARAALGYAAFRRLRRDFSAGMELDGLARRFRPLLGEPATLPSPAREAAR